MKTNIPAISLVVETSPVYGRGHIARCILLAKALRSKGADCRFFLTDRLQIDGLESFPTSLLTDGLPPSGNIVIVDGYRFAPSCLEKLKASSARLVVIDDLADRDFPADVILNHNLYATDLDYQRHGSAKLLLGLRYCLVRSEYCQLAGQSSPSTPAVLITLGSGPLASSAEQLARTINRQFGIRVDATLGADTQLPNDNSDTLHFHRFVELSQLIANASLVICGLGVTFLEVMATGRQVIGVQVADNQRLAYRAAASLGYSVFEHIDQQLISLSVGKVLNGECRTISDNKFFIDGRGSFRAAAAILDTKGLRHADMS